MFKSSQIHHLSRLLPLLSDRQFHNLDIVCRGGDVVTSSTLLIAALVSSKVVRELVEIEKNFLESPVTIILPECSSDDVTAILGVIVDVNSTATEIDASFVEKYYWIDVEKIASDRGKISANVDCADQQRDSGNLDEVDFDEVKEENDENDPEWENEFSFEDDDDDAKAEASDAHDLEGVGERKWRRTKPVSKENKIKMKRKRKTGDDMKETKKKRIGSVYAEYAEWNYKTKNGMCKVCNQKFHKDPRRLQRHVERAHLGNFNKRKYEKKLLLQELVKTNEDDDAKLCEDKSINEVSAELRAIKDDGKRMKIQEKLDELTSSGYKLGKTGRLYKKEQCAICGKTLCSKYALKKHEDAVHFNIRAFGCDICSKRFIMKNDLRDHITAVHKKIKSCVCDICGLKLATQHGLRVHKLVHQEDTKCIRCDRCDKTFRHMCTFRRHIERMHEFNPEKRLKCDDCGKLFNHREGLATHVKKFHTPQAVVFKCHLCNSAFAYRYERTKHLRRFHKMEKRLAIAISADDVAPEIAETCFGNLGHVDEDENDESEESGDEIEEDKNRSAPNNPANGGPIRGATNQISLQSQQAGHASQESASLRKFRPQQQQYQSFTTLLASHAHQQAAAVTAHQHHQAAAVLMADQAAASHLQMAMGTLGTAHPFTHQLHFQRP